MIVLFVQQGEIIFEYQCVHRRVMVYNIPYDV